MKGHKGKEGWAIKSEGWGHWWGRWWMGWRFRDGGYLMRLSPELCEEWVMLKVRIAEASPLSCILLLLHLKA